MSWNSQNHSSYPPPPPEPLDEEGYPPPPPNYSSTFPPGREDVSVIPGQNRSNSPPGASPLRPQGALQIKDLDDPPIVEYEKSGFYSMEARMNDIEKFTTRIMTQGILGKKNFPVDKTRLVSKLNPSPPPFISLNQVSLLQVPELSMSPLCFFLKLLCVSWKQKTQKT